jgi:hypothetical protein
LPRLPSLLGARQRLGCSTAVRPNITRHARLATVATERELDQLAPGSVLAKKNNGVFPFDSVYEIIDGRKTIIDHGTRDVPIWGDRYTPEPSKALIPRPSENILGFYDPETVVQMRILAVIDYLNRIQEK